MTPTTTEATHALKLAERINRIDPSATMAAVAESALTTRCREEPKTANATIGSSIV